MADILRKIEAYKRIEISEAKVAMPLQALERRIRAQDPPRGFVHEIETRLASGDYALIAEIKKASPSKGLIRSDFEPADLAKAYERGGATCLSVLTDRPSFQGGPEHLAAAHQASRLPVLRKDFLFDPYQVFEARAWGADCILIIMAAIDDARACELNQAAHDAKVDSLIEVHDEAELERALRLEARLIGVNNRDLRTFHTDLAVAERLAALVPRDRIVVAESGVARHGDVERLAQAGVRAFLVGESLMRASDVAAAVHALLHGSATKQSASR